VVASTTTELGDLLDDCFQWRRSELAALKTEIERTSKANSAHAPRDRMVLRAAVALIYAHWEGFVKDACQHYLDFVAKRRLKYSELSDPWLHTSLRRIVAAGSGTSDAVDRLASAIRRGGAERAALSRKGVVETRANLRHETVCDIMNSLGLPLGMIETRAQLIDRRLCDARNSVAHGRATFPEPGGALELHREVLEMMEYVRNSVISAAENARYRVPAPADVTPDE
jgi:hypothetical protein